MKNRDVKLVLKETESIVDSMNKDHIRKLYDVLIGTQSKHKIATFVNMDLKKLVKKLIDDCIESRSINRTLTRKQMKNIYAIIGDYGYRPVCPLCHNPIRINTKALKSDNKEGAYSFTWDHVIPKSLGGVNDLSNLQPTHKICNNHKGDGICNCEKPEYRVSYKIQITMVFEDPEPNLCKLKGRKKKQIKPLRKQDGWCHKQRCQYHR